MFLSSFALLAIIAAASVTAQEAVPGTTILKTPDGADGHCEDEQKGYYDFAYSYGISSATACNSLCQSAPSTHLLGFSYVPDDDFCVCHYDDGFLPVNPAKGCGVFQNCSHKKKGDGPIEFVNKDEKGFVCYVYTQGESNGDPHFRTWKDEHFEFHGQCDVVFSKAKDFVGPGKDLDIHLRTSMVRYWSYIKTVAIRIGNDILEVEGSAAKEDGVDKRHYRINYEYRGSLEDGIGGFPISISPRNNIYTIDLNSKFPGQMIQIKTFKEFVGVKIIGANQESFGNSVGILGDFDTGKTLARDGQTVLHDFNELGLEWQVLPSDGKLFHEMARPQFPELCYLPEDPRGERTRRLGESDITEEAAEAACAGLKDEFDRKGCIYDILATQDMDMVGAY